MTVEELINELNRLCKDSPETKTNKVWFHTGNITEEIISVRAYDIYNVFLELE